MSSNSFHFTESFTSEVTTRNKVRTPSSVSKSHSTANFARTGYAASNRPGNTASVSRIAADLIELQNRGLSRQSASAAIARSTSALQIQQRNCPNYQPPAPRSPPCNQPCNQPQPCRNEPCAASQTFLSSVESAILRANVPIEVNETEEITVNGERGIWANRAEVNNWKGCVPLGEYQINVDPNPEVITKRACQMLEYVQELAIRYLRPPTPPAPGEILISQECNTLTPPAPPLIIRQQPARPCTPEPLVVREAPPSAPEQIGKKVITISGKRLPPPPRKVVIERLAPIPVKPQSVIIERWLPYSEVKRRVIFNRPCCQDPVVCKPKNIIVQWEAPQVQIKKEFKYLGVIKANPCEYVQRYGASLTTSENLPDFVHEIKTPDGLVLAADYKYNPVHELEGDVDALKLIDLDKEGLSQYREYLLKLFQDNARGSQAANNSVSSQTASLSVSQSIIGATSSFQSATVSAKSTISQENLIELIFKSIDYQSTGRIHVNDAEKILLRLNSRLSRSYGEDDVNALFESLDENHDNTIDLDEFRKAFQNLNID